MQKLGKLAVMMTTLAKRCAERKIEREKEKEMTELELRRYKVYLTTELIHAIMESPIAKARLAGPVVSRGTK